MYFKKILTASLLLLSFASQGYAAFHGGGGNNAADLRELFQTAREAGVKVEDIPRYEQHLLNYMAQKSRIERENLEKKRQVADLEHRTQQMKASQVSAEAARAQAEVKARTDLELQKRDHEWQERMDKQRVETEKQLTEEKARRQKQEIDHLKAQEAALREEKVKTATEEERAKLQARFGNEDWKRQDEEHFKQKMEVEERIGREVGLKRAELDAKNDLELGHARINFLNRFLKNEDQMMTKTAAVVVGVFGSYFILKYGVPIAAEKVREKLFKPRLIKESSRQSWLEKLVDGKKDEKYHISSIVLPNELQRNFNELAISTRHAKDKGLGYTHTLFYGPPGTGKTFGAKIIAMQSGLDWAVIAGSAFDQFDEKEALRELDKIFQWIESSKNGLVVFIDEADAMLGVRDGKNPKLDKLVNMFLSHVETASHDKAMFVFATNHPHLLDPAVRSRISNMYYFPLPQEAERLRQLKGNMEREIINQGFAVSKQVLDALPEVAAQTEGFSGRTLLSLAQQLRNSAIIRGAKTIELELFKFILHRVKERHFAELKMQGLDPVRSGYFNPEVSSASGG